ncbi:ATP-binding protein [Caenimonas terrae]|uniref:ATP-binding protein n=1 Tax=Caenimonas terrae TaxID=696074 RepID=A0ABW0NHA5_9BURK
MVAPGDKDKDKDKLARWLDTLGLAAHAETFHRNDVDLELLPTLSDADLKELGLSLGHRRMLLAALRDLQDGQDQRPPRRSQAAPPKSEQGERRQITVMFCDLVGSTELSGRLDLDDLRSLIHSYYSSCCTIIEEAGGFTARLVGDGILAYFGYPVAREDAAECAIRASLRIVEALASGRRDGGSQLDVHIGLATGMSVISDMVGSGFAERHAATGLTPNLAARIQALATAGSVVIADETRRLAGGLFMYADLGWHQLKGLDKPVRAWKVVGESLSGVRFDARRTEIFECLGRDAELAALQAGWERARGGQCSIVTLVGEAGIGKSRLLRTASERFARSSGLAALLQCSPNQASTPLHPLIAWIRQEARVGAGDGPDNLEQLGAWLGTAATELDLALVADLLGLRMPAARALPPMPPDRQRNLTREVLLRHLERHCEAAPVLFMLEDAHWMDGATADFLAALFGRMRHKPFMALVTSRPPGRRDWGETGVREIRLEPLQQADAQRLVHNVCHGHSLPPAVVSQILAKTDGIPLFIEELTATVLESRAASGGADAPAADAPLPALDIPSTLRDSLMARLDRLDDAKEVARMASALGREFSFPLLLRVTGQPPGVLAAALERLVKAQLLFRRGPQHAAEYVFKHALIQQAAYEGQLRSDRQALHARIVQAIEAHQPEVASREPGLMAHHCHEAALPEREVEYLYAAGLASTRMVAIAEALSYFSRAQELIAGLEPTPRNVGRHIDIILGLMEVGRFAILPSRLMELGALARQLSRIEGVSCDAATLSAILFQEARAHLYSSRYAEARRLFGEIRKLGRDTGAALIEMKPASALAMDLCCQGLFNEMLDFINESNVGHYKVAGSFIDYISGLGWIAYAACQMGPGDDGLRFADLSVREAELVQSPIYLGGARIWRSHALMAVRRLDEAVADARRCVELSRIHSVPYLDWHGLVFLALCLCRSGRFDQAGAALAEARALLARVAQGQWSLLDYLPAIEAEIACGRGDYARGIAAADEAIAVARALGGHFAEAIAWRARAVGAVMTGGDPQQAQAMFDQAVALFRQGGARAEEAFATLAWSHALQLSGHADRAQQSARAAQALARVQRLDLARCEFGAAAML